MNNNLFSRPLRKVKKDGEFEIKRNSWVFVVVWNIFNEKIKRKKTKFHDLVYNWVISDSYKKSYCWYMSKTIWTDLHSIINGKNPIIAHIRNVWDLWNSPNGKFLRKVLKLNNGKYPIPNPKNLLCLSTLFNQAKTKREMRIVLWYPVLPADDEKKRQEILDIIEKTPKLKKFYYSDKLNFLHRHQVQVANQSITDIETIES